MQHGREGFKIELKGQGDGGAVAAQRGQRQRSECGRSDVPEFEPCCRLAMAIGWESEVNLRSKISARSSYARDLSTPDV